MEIASFGTNVTARREAYLESGHSQMEVDSMHACIERARKHKQIYSTNEYRGIIEGARKRPYPYKVNQMAHSEFYNLETLAEVVVKNRTKATDGKKVNWLKVKFFQFKRGSNLVAFKYNVDDPEFSYLNVNDEMCAVAWTYIKLLIKYPKLLPISLAKKKDLLSLLKCGVIPKAYEYFINSLPCDKKVKDVAILDADKEEDPDDPAAK